LCDGERDGGVEPRPQLFARWHRQTRIADHHRAFARIDPWLVDRGEATAGSREYRWLNIGLVIGERSHDRRSSLPGGRLGR
jgi:hypothetical protein